jgi:integrase
MEFNMSKGRQRVIPLTDTKIKSAKPKDKKYKLADGGGLYVEVAKSGSKLWRLKYQFNGKEKLLSLGAYPSITLKRARELREENKTLIAEGINPSELKKEKKEQAKAKEIQKEQDKKFTFENLANDLLLERLESGEISQVHHKRMYNSFINDVYPFIGDKPIKKVTTHDIKAIISNVANRGANESARKLYYAISKTFKTLVTRDNPYNPETNYQITNPPADISLDDLIGKKAKRNYPTITDDKGIRELLLAIDTYGGNFTTKQALRMLPYVFVRPFNIRHAEWSEINFKQKQWIIPGKKMKTKRELIIPLTDTVIEILKETKPFTGTGKYIFPSLKGDQAMSDNTLTSALRRLDYTKEQFVPHGFRAMFSTVAHEKSKFSHEAIETQLAHSVGSSVSQAYNRAIYLDERVQLMQWWSDYLDNLKKI